MSAALPRTRGSRLSMERLLVHLALVLVIAVFGAPFVLIAVTAVAIDPEDIWPWPGSLTLDHIVELSDRFDIERLIGNGLIVAGGAAVLATTSGALAGYALSRARGRWPSRAALAVLLLQTMPLSATMIPIYDLALRLRLDNTYRGLIVAHAALSLPFLVWLLKGFFDALPAEIEEAAAVDGASRPRTWRDILLPLARPGLAVGAGFAFLTAWAEILIVVILVTRDDFATIPFAFYYAEGQEATSVTAAVGVVYLLPVLILFLILRRWMVRGLAGAVTGA
ncbi:MAG: carbohydrate ABC transporter permease [Thermomicrobiales bacterium]